MPAHSSATSVRARAPLPRDVGWTWLDVLIAVGVALLVSIALPAPPDRVDLHITNPTVYDLTLSATDEHRDGWVTLASVEAGSTADAGDVVDQGDVWILRFRGQGFAGGEIRVRGDALEADGWSFEVPAEIGDRLRSEGAQPSPP